MGEHGEGPGGSEAESSGSLSEVRSGDRQLTAYRLDPLAPPIRPAPSRRTWMDATKDRFAYRCLPMVIANQSGWEILSPASVSATWDGRTGRDAIHLDYRKGPKGHVSSHFGSGVLTFHVGYLFRTPPGINLWVKGPTNQPRNGIMPLEGVVETDWSVAPFTMNWRFTRAGVAAYFVKGDPICTIVPVPRGLAESLEPRLVDIHDEPELFSTYERWRDGRGTFIEELRRDDDTPAKRQRWQREYFKGYLPEGGRFEAHQTKLHLKSFEEE